MEENLFYDLVKTTVGLSRYGISGYVLYGWRKAKGQRASMISTSTDEPEESGLHR